MAYKNQIAINIVVNGQAQASAALTKVAADAKEQQTAVAAAAEESASRQSTAYESATAKINASQDSVIASNKKVAASTTSSMSEASAAVQGYGDATEKTASKSAASSGVLSKVGLIAAGVAVAAAVATGVMVKQAGNYQAAITRLATSAGESESNLSMVSDGVLQIARDTGTATTQLTAAMYTIESGGQHGAAGLNVLKAAAQGAKTENADLVTVADAVTSAMTDYHLAAGQAATVTSKLVAATSQGKTTFQELAGAMPAILPIASAAHISLNEILGDMASMTLHGISAQQSAENMADAIRHLQSPTQAESKELAALGLNATELSQNLGTVGLSGTINQISTAIQSQMGPGTSAVILNMQNALKGLPKAVQDVSQGVINGTSSWSDWNIATKNLTVTQKAQADAFATLYNGMHTIGTEQMSGAQVMQTYAGAMQKAMGDSTGLNVALMIGGQNAGNTSKAISAVSAASADASGNVRGWADIQKNFNQQMSVLKEDLGTTAIAIGTALLPALTTMAQDVEAVLGPVASFVGNNKELSAGILLTVGGLAAFVAVSVGVQKAAGLTNQAFSPLVSVVKKLAESVGLLDATEDTQGLGKVTSELTGMQGAAKGASKELSTLASSKSAITSVVGDLGEAGAGEGLLAALGPIGLTLGAVAVTAGVTYLAIKHIHDESNQTATDMQSNISPAAKQFNDLASTLGVTIKGTGAQVGLLKLAEDKVTTAHQMVAVATKNVKSDTDALNGTMQTAKKRQDDVTTAQDGVKAAYDKFGQNSPQYQTAVKNLSDKQWALDQAEAQTAVDSIKLQIQQGNLSAANSELKGATTELTGTQKALNDALKGGAGVIATFGPTAFNQVSSIATLQTSMSKVVTTWNTFSMNFQQQNTAVNQILTGMTQNVNYLQTQSSAINKNLSAASNSAISLQKAGGGNLQGSSGVLQGHALGTSYAPGGMTNLAETGAELVTGPTTGYLPTGSKVYSASQTASMMGGSKQLFIQNLNVNNNVDVGLVARQIGWQLKNA